MAELTLRNARTSIERGIVRAIANAYKVRAPAVATVAALRALPSAGIPHDTYRYVTSATVCYRWNRYSSATDDGINVLKPNDLVSGKPGRWLVTSSAIQTGYLKSVQAYNGAAAIEDVVEKLLGQSPSVLVVWTSGDHKIESQNPGALWWYLCNFDIWVIGSNLRDGFETEEGSDVPAEALADPGVNQILGDVKYVLAGADYDLESVSYTQLGQEMRIAEDQASRQALEKLSVQVHASIHKPDTDLVDFPDPGSLYVQYQEADTPENLGERVGPTDYIRTGCTMPTGSSLTQTPDAGTAYVGSTLITVTAGAKTFTANKFTYRDLKLDGTYTYTEVGPYGTPADPAVDTLRVGVTVTDGTNVIFDRILADSLIDYGPPDQVPPT